MFSFVRELHFLSLLVWKFLCSIFLIITWSHSIFCAPNFWYHFFVKCSFKEKTFFWTNCNYGYQSWMIVPQKLLLLKWVLGLLSHNYANPPVVHFSSSSFFLLVFLAHHQSRLWTLFFSHFSPNIQYSGQKSLFLPQPHKIRNPIFSLFLRQILSEICMRTFSYTEIHLKRWEIARSANFFAYFDFKISKNAWKQPKMATNCKNISREELISSLFPWGSV